MGFPGADSPPILFFSASTMSPFEYTDSCPLLAPLFGVASMGFPGADPPQFLLFSDSTVVLVILETSLSLCLLDRGGRRSMSPFGSQDGGGRRVEHS